MCPVFIDISEPDLSDDEMDVNAVHEGTSSTTGVFPIFHLQVFTASKQGKSP